MDNKEMILMWMKDALKDERAKRNRAEQAYNSLQNRDTTYATGLKRVLEIRESIVAIWEKAAADYKEVQVQQPTAQGQNTAPAFFVDCRGA